MLRRGCVAPVRQAFRRAGALPQENREDLQGVSLQPQLEAGVLRLRFADGLVEKAVQCRIAAQNAREAPAARREQGE